jgi:hypothetical protein
MDIIRCRITYTEPCGGTAAVNSNDIQMVLVPLVVPTISVTVPSIAPIGSTVSVNAVVSDAGSSYSITWMNKGVVFATTTTPLATYTKTAVTDSITAKVVSTSTGCFDTITSVLHVVNAAVEGIASLTPLAMNILPNPARNELIITATAKIKNITIANLLGQALISHPANASTERINISELPNGIYIVRVTDSEGNTITQKILKQ